MPFVVLALIALQTGTTPPAVEPAPSRNHTFINANIVGQLTGPHVGIVYARPKTTFRNLIELRKDFRPEMTKGASGL